MPLFSTTIRVSSRNTLLSNLLHSCLAVDALIVCVIGLLYFSPLFRTVLYHYRKSCTKKQSANYTHELFYVRGYLINTEVLDSDREELPRLLFVVLLNSPM